MKQKKQSSTELISAKPGTVTWNPLKKSLPDHWSRLGNLSDEYYSQRFHEAAPSAAKNDWNSPETPWQLPVLHLRPPLPHEPSLGFSLTSAITLYTTVSPQWFWMYRQACTKMVQLQEVARIVQHYSLAFRKRECLQVWMGSWNAMPCIWALCPREWAAHQAAVSSAERFGRFVQKDALLKACIQLQGLTPTNDSDPGRTEQTRQKKQDWPYLTLY